jgi:outer membrane lipoprotein-sorting protein
MEVFMHIKRSLSFILATAVAAALVAAGSARAAGSAPAIAAFDAAMASTNDYTYTMKSHEQKGSQTQDRTYSYEFLKPHYVKTLIMDGDGKGGGGVWTGGTQVSGHQGGLLSAIHLKVDLHDPKAISLLGYTIPDGLLQNIVGNYTIVAGTLSEGAGGVVDGVNTDRVENAVTNPAANGGVTKMVLYMNHDTHWPVRQIVYAGTVIILDQHFQDIKTNTGLKPSDFPF